MRRLRRITWEPEGPFGAKEAGQGAGTGVIAALANAVYDATGVRLNRLPLTPERVLSGIKALQKQDANSRP